MTATNSAPEARRVDTRTRFIDAPATLVFETFRNADSLARWWGPTGFHSTFYEFDFRTGGRWHFTMHGPDGKDYENEMRFVEIKENELIVMEHFSGHHFFLTLRFESQGNSTLVHWQQVFDTIEHYKQICDFVSVANEQNLDKYVTEIKRKQTGH